VPIDPHFEQFYQRGTSLFLVLEKDGTIAWLSDNWSQVLGWKREEMLGNPCKDYIHPDDAKEVMERLAELETEDDILTFESRHRKNDGSWRWLLWDAHRDMESGHIYACARDVTALQTTNRILEGRQRLLTMIETIARIGYWRYDLELEEMLWSDEMFHIHGIPVADKGPSMETIMRMYKADERETLACSLETLAEQGEPFHFELKFEHPNEEIRFVRMKGHLERDIDGAPVALCGIMQDITEEKELRSRAIQLERLDSLGMLAAGIAHEINNPLAYIDGNLELLHEMLGHQLFFGQRNQDVEEILSDVREGFDRIGKIVHGLRSFARADAELSRHEFETLTIEQIIQDAITLTGYEVRRYANLELAPFDANLKVSGNVTQLTQVLVNILLNSSQSFGQRHRQSNAIKIAVSSTADEVIIDVQDNGAGIPEEIQRQLFSPYITTKKRQGSLGLGLSLSKQIITAHQGELKLVESSPSGTTMRIQLPREHEQRPESIGVKGMERVLIVEDALGLGPTLGRLLGSAYETHFCANASIALEKLARGERFMHILCELDMVDMTGEEFWLAAAGQGYEDRIIFLAGAIDEDLRAFLQDSRAHVLLKPFKGKDLLEKLRSIDPPGEEVSDVDSSLAP
jgi:PAS domain S-box-containing protein